MTVAVEIIGYPLLALWFIGPFLSLWIGWRRGQPFLGFLAGFAPIIGPFLAPRLPRDR